MQLRNQTCCLRRISERLTSRSQRNGRYFSIGNDNDWNIKYCCNYRLPTMVGQLVV